MILDACKNKVKWDSGDDIGVHGQDTEAPVITSRTGCGTR